MAATKAGRRNVLVPVIIGAVAVVLIVAVLIFQGGSEDESPASGKSDAADAPDGVVDSAEQQNQQSDVDVERRDPDDPLAIGEVDAPVGIVMYSDFQCPFCAQWTAETLPELMPYVDDGDVRIEWRDLELFGPESRRGAIAAYAAGLQGEYLPFHEALFEGGDKPSEAELTDDGLAELAESLNLDMDTYYEDVEDPDVEAAIEENIAEANELGAYSTPAFLISGEPVVGAQPADVFTDAVEDALASAD